MPPREVKLKTIIALFRAKPGRAFLGIYFIAFSILFMIGGVSITLSFMDRTVPNVDYEAIDKDGKLAKGKITNIEIQYKITDNGEHPAVISYGYLKDNQQVESKYQILSPDKVNLMKIGDTIDIKYLENESIINGYQPYSFPVEIFIIVSVPLLVIGILIFIPIVMRFREDLHLYKHGKVHDADVVSIEPKFALPFFTHKQRILIHYHYKTSNGQNILGESLTADFSILNDKKQGDMIKIFVSRDDESKSCYIPKLEAMRNNWNID